ncbi:MAG: hypothetical protein M1812_000359 [Candelaria pacifica]|nr:MAG: hypothetical protein M1812_000359 [Candelaria pacifica]
MSVFEFTFSIGGTTSFENLLHSLKNTSKTFAFLSLPPELRNKVYRLLLVSTKTFTVGLRFGSFDTSLLCVNKQIHEEASGIFYEENTFRIPQSLFISCATLDQLRDLYRLPASRLRQLRNLNVEIPVYGPYHDQLFYQQVVQNVWALTQLLRDGLTPLKIDVNIVEPWVETSAGLEAGFFLEIMRPWAFLWKARRPLGEENTKVSLKILSKSPHLPIVLLQMANMLEFTQMEEPTIVTPN